MDIAALSMDISAVSTKQQAQFGILKMAMDLPKIASEVIIDEMQNMQKELESLLMPYLGQNIDMYA
ncbi:MAG: YjfB family protein [Oscillospiraceae bacterium]|nr:YjfB family protein [Oscillospiraceae bacterium]MCL2126575.1 YjfB family protein [Oscillospiraceae bacterium]